MQKTTFLLLIAFFAASASVRAVTFDPSVRYSVTLINARMTEWNNKSKTVGFSNTASTNGKTDPATIATWDYVPGVVAKGILETWYYYQDQSFAEPWFEGLSVWAASNYTKVPVNGGSLDDLNCAKVFFRLYDGAKAGGKYADAAKAANWLTALNSAATGLTAHDAQYSISSEDDVANGGWFHKSNYKNQMWCDGAYMGPALLAQLLAYKHETDNDGNGTTTINCQLGWDEVMDQFTSSWYPLWDSEKQLLWHAYSTDKSSGYADDWLYADGQLPIGGGYHSAEYWSRANGWYIMSLVDVLEAMEQVGKKGDADYTLLLGFLHDLANGLVARQDAASGCWFQLLQYDDTKCATPADDTGSSTTTNGGNQCNYLESSGSCLIVGALLKAIRLGYLDNTVYGEKAKKGFEGIVTNFVQGAAGNYTISTSCESAGVGNGRNGSAAYYLIGKDVGINNKTEGKAFGPFLMAAVEYERAYMPLVPDAPESDCQCLSVTLIPNE